MKISMSVRVLVVSLAIGFSQSQAEEKTYHIPIPNKDVIEDKWFGDTFVTNGMNDEILKVGGWGDIYYSLIKMPAHLHVKDATRIIINKATMNLRSFGSQNPTTMSKGFVRGPWTETSTEDHWHLPYSVTGSIPAPSGDPGLYKFDITWEYYYWVSGKLPNHGILLIPENNNNHFNYFRSSKNIEAFRPYVEVFYEKVPDFKLPLPGGKAWKLTVEAGGKAYNSQQAVGDSFHTGHTYYSLDFSPRSKPISGGVETLETDVPIYAAANGIVTQVASTVANDNGWFVKIDHDGDTNELTGFQTIYIHLKNRSHLKKYDKVNQGDLLGIMGTTGVDDNGVSTSTSVHLHMTFYFQNKPGVPPSAQDDSLHLDFLRMEGRALKDYKLSTNWKPDLGQWEPIYYESSNKP